MLFPTGELLFVTAGYAVSMLLGLGFGVFVLMQRGRTGAHVAFFLMCAALAGFQLSFILGANTADPGRAYLFWFANLVDVFLAIFYLHFIILALDALPRFRKLLYADYAAGLAILAASLAFPRLFLPTVAPALYFRTYLVGGPLYAAMLAFFLASFVASFAVMFLERPKHGEEGKRRIGYYVFSLFYGFATGITAFPLVFGVRLDPVASVLIGTFVIPMVYGMVKKDLLDIRIVFKRSLFFAAAVALIAGVLTAVSLLSQLLAPLIPGFFYAVPIVAALAAAAAGAVYLGKANEAEKVKYEFLTVVAHKFRTPLTRIRWASEALKEDAALSPDSRTLVAQVLEADLALIELSNLLMDAVQTEKESAAYIEKDIDPMAVVEAALGAQRSAVSAKRLSVSIDAPQPIARIHADAQRLQSALSVLIDNAIAYTPEDGSISIRVSGAPDEFRFAIRDSGIGIDPAELPYLFKKFYRGDRARREDTEGVGVGLSLAKAIVERERGSIGARSDGPGKGSEFWLTLPAAKDAT